MSRINKIRTMKLKFYFLLIACLFSTLVFSQEKSIAQESDEIKKVVIKMFDAMRVGDSASFKSAFYSDVRLQTIVLRKGKLSLENEELQKLAISIGTPHKEKWDERITSWNFQINDLMATVHTDYEFYIDSTYSHCGVNVFQLIKDNGNWKIFAITDTRKRECMLSAKEFGGGDKVKIFEREIHQLMDYWHKFAATGDLKSFFEFMDDDFIYLGTESSERWDKKTFYAFSEPQFKKVGGAWNFKPYNRKIYFSEDYHYAWFEETLTTWMGVCRGSGVLYFKGDTWKLKHYNLSVTIDNDKIQKFIEISK